MHWSEDLVNPLFMMSDVAFTGLKELRMVQMKLTHVLYLGKDG
jgi:hypothetical protein